LYVCRNRQFFLQTSEWADPRSRWEYGDSLRLTPFNVPKPFK
jgi:hypothetical protein